MEQQQSGYKGLPTTEDAKEIFELTKVSKAFKVHCYIGGAITAICAIVWFFTNFGHHVYPWFIHPLAFFLMTTTFHFYILIRRPREWLTLHVSWFIIVNLMIFLLWIFNWQHQGSAWFLYVAGGWAILLSIHISLNKYKGDPNRAYNTHLAFFLSLNLLLFIIWLDGSRYPWFIFSFFGSSIPLVIHYSVHFHPKDYLMLHALLFANVQSLLFFTWGVSSQGFPWFIFPLVGWGLLLFVHYHTVSSRRFFYNTSSSPLPTTNNPYYPQQGFYNPVPSANAPNGMPNATQPSPMGYSSNLYFQQQQSYAPQAASPNVVHANNSATPSVYTVPVSAVTTSPQSYQQVSVVTQSPTPPPHSQQ